MGRFFDDDVERALKHIFYDMRTDNFDGKRGLELLISATKRGDADAAYFLARCYAGPQFIWDKYQFPEKDDEVTELMQRSILQGSAVGLLGGIRTVGVVTPEIEAQMPFESTKEAWDMVYQKAEQGEPFCQYMIGNTYFWGDIIEIENKTQNSFGSEQAFDNYLRQSLQNSVTWLDKAFKNGVYLAGQNLINLYSEGKGDLFPAQPERKKLLIKQGAELGYPSYQGRYASLLDEEKEYGDALYWYKKAYENGMTEYMYEIGMLYLNGNGTQKDIPYALECFEQSIVIEQRIGGYNRAAAIYFEGADRIPKNYPRAVEYFENARKGSSHWGNDMLAYCYVKGHGCARDYAYAKQLLDEVDWTSELKSYCLGLMYVDGLGVPEDIKKGVEYLQKAAKELPEAVSELSRFKKNLFGGWARKKK